MHVVLRCAVLSLCCTAHAVPWPDCMCAVLCCAAQVMLCSGPTVHAVLRCAVQVMLCLNLCMEPYLVNGSRGVVVGWVDARQERVRLERQIEVLEAMVAATQGSQQGGVY